MMGSLNPFRFLDRELLDCELQLQAVTSALGRPVLFELADREAAANLEPFVVGRWLKPEGVARDPAAPTRTMLSAQRRAACVVAALFPPTAHPVPRSEYWRQESRWIRRDRACCVRCTSSLAFYLLAQ
jgi:hypothetical protein